MKSRVTCPTRQKGRVFIVDDHPTIRRGLKALFRLEADLVVCGEAEGATDAWTKITALRPDVVVADLTLREGDGLELIERLRKAIPDLIILAFTMHNTAPYLACALKAGADDVVVKGDGAEQVIVSIRELLHRRTRATGMSGAI